MSFKTYEGLLDASKFRFAIVCSRFNDFFVSKLLSGAQDCILRHGAKTTAIEVVKVPGAYEIPLVTKRMALSKNYNAIIALGVVIQGATSHAQFINADVSKSLAQISLDSGVPIINGVISTENLEQAIERSGTKAGNRGFSAALAAIEMASLMPNLPSA